jgi:2-polyprenyl-3-methyl-5-hydroxy-6-metoxy-1,4-benzoquinol methylase
MTTTIPANPLGVALRRALRIAVRNTEEHAESGVHVDPLVESAPEWQLSPKEQMLRTSPELRMFSSMLTIDGKDVRESVLDDLAAYHHCTPEEARERAMNWEQASVEEWESVDGSDSDEGRVAFYRTQQSWSYDLLWWAYLQTEGWGDPASVMAYRWLQQYSPGRRHLDFGSGVGTTSQLFIEGGWRSTLSDLSSTLLDFAKFRLERRGEQAQYIDLGTSGLPAGAYDSITAIDTLAHVPDVYATGLQLHAALGRDGYLVANFDIRKPTRETVWHLEADDLAARYELRRAGFKEVADLGYDLLVYRKVRPSGPRALLRQSWDWLTLVSPPRRIGRVASRPFLKALGRLRKKH